MNARYVVEILGEGLAGLMCDGQRQLWSAAKIRVRDKTCCLCGAMVKKGAVAYRPIANTFNRYERAHKDCVERS